MFFVGWASCFVRPSAPSLGALARGAARPLRRVESDAIVARLRSKAHGARGSEMLKLLHPVPYYKAPKSSPPARRASEIESTAYL